MASLLRLKPAVESVAMFDLLFDIVGSAADFGDEAFEDEEGSVIGGSLLLRRVRLSAQGLTRIVC